MASPSDILEFWFSDHARERWFRKDAAFDDEIRARFAADVVAAAAGEHVAWQTSGDGALALSILLDQFPRNLYRGSAQAFAADDRAREVANHVIANQLDETVALERRMFFYLPFEHSESLADQERAVELFTRWAAAHPEAKRAQADEIASYAVRHRDVIQRFGRFPHRNAVVGRASTAEEVEFLTQPGSSF
jgi:uncharacterized protein (DUF924 family)